MSQPYLALHGSATMPIMTLLCRRQSPSVTSSQMRQLLNLTQLILQSLSQHHLSTLQWLTQKLCVCMATMSCQRQTHILHTSSSLGVTVFSSLLSGSTVRSISVAFSDCTFPRAIAVLGAILGCMKFSLNMYQGGISLSSYKKTGESIVNIYKTMSQYLTRKIGKLILAIKVKSPISFTHQECVNFKLSMGSSCTKLE